MMVTRNAETNQGDSGVSYAPPPPAPADHLRSRAGNTVFKSGPLFISSKGIGWTSWKKRWFILTRTSLVFFRNDPSILPQKGSEVNLTLGGIDLNNSGSVVVREDKKLLTVLFPDGRDGRAFTLKAETSEDLYDWKAALENALQQAPSAALVMGQNGIFRNDPSETADGATEQWKDRRPVKSLVVGRPILLALEDIDGAPSFLEKALTFIETHGVKVEGVLRQAADVDDVNRRVREYEEGKNEFTSEEDAHIIADCVKHVLRGLPSSPVPASCCNALLEACRADRGVRVNAMRAAISETFPEPNRRLLQRILKMMQIVASHKSENRMSSSAVAACMAPLLLRPLLAGDCELENDFTMGGDGSVQLLQAAAAANHAQAIVITLMEDYQKIFGDGSLQGSISPEIYSDSEESGSEDDELTDDDELVEDDGDFDSQNDSDGETEDDHDYAFSGSASECAVDGDEQYDNKASEGFDSDLGSVDLKVEQKSSNETQNFIPQHENEHCNGSSKSLRDTRSVEHASESHESSVDVPVTASPAVPVETDHSLSPPTEADHTLSSLSRKLTTKKSSKPLSGPKLHTIWGRTSAKKNLSMEFIDFHNEEEAEIQKLESAKSDLQTKIVKEAKENAALHTSLEKRKKALHDRRLALEQDVAGLQEQLQKERDLRAAMDARLNIPQGPITMSPSIDNKTKAELEDISRAEEDVINLKNKVADLHLQLNQQRKNNSGLGSCSQPEESLNFHGKQGDEREDSETTSVAPLHERPTKTEEVLSRADSKHVKTQETPSLQKKLTEKPQLDLPVHEGNKSFGSPGTPSPVGLGTVAPSVSSNSKKSSSKVEGNATTSSALSKLTTRLNFLKERRTQIVNELQNIESSRGSETQLLAAAPRTNSR